jgi:hypothetical protein
METTTSAAPVKDPARILALMGFKEGPPSGMSLATLEIDRRVYSVMRCTCCKGRGMAFTPYHRGEDYRALVTCRRCGHAEEV